MTRDPLTNPIKDGDLELRPLVARDSGDLYLLVNDHRRHLRRWLPWVDATRAVADMNYYILSLTGLWKTGLTYGVFVDQTLCGTVGFHRGDFRHHRAELGYWLAPPFQGRGLAYRAVKNALDAAFAYTPLHRVEARVQGENQRSISLLKKLNFSFEGTERGGLKFGTEYRDHQIYSLLRPEYLA